MPRLRSNLAAASPKTPIAIFNQGYSLPASVPFLDIPQPNMGALLAGVNGLKDAECGPCWPSPAGNAIRCQCFPRFPRPRRALNVEVASGTVGGAPNTMVAYQGKTTRQAESGQHVEGRPSESRDARHNVGDRRGGDAGKLDACMISAWITG